MGIATNNLLLSGSNEEIWQLFQKKGEVKEYSPQTVLLSQDEPIEYIYFIESGLVKLTRMDAAGRDIVAALRLPGTMLGAASVVSGNPAPASAITLYNSRLSFLPARIFLQQMEVCPLFALRVSQTIGQNYYEQTLHQARLNTLTACGRVASLLLQFAQTTEQNQNGEIRLQLPLNQTDSAGLLAMSREHYNRTLNDLEKKGLLRRSQGWIYIFNLKLLKEEIEN